MVDIQTDTAFKLEVNGLSAALSVARLEGVEAVSELFHFDLVVTSDDKLISFADVIGKPAVLTIDPGKGDPRYVNGIISRFRQAEDGHKVVVYHATLVPKLWRLQHRQESRIFQEQTAPDIIQKVLKGAGITDVRLALSASYATREYCVQYRETDFAFISRLMEEEGIYYFFEHTDSQHVLVLADSPSAPAPIPGDATVVFRPGGGALSQASESVLRFSHTEELQPGKVALSDFNFKKPSLSLLTSSEADEGADHEIYDYPGEYDVPGDGTALSKVRLEELQALRKVSDGASTCMRLTPGYTFSLSDHGRDEFNAKYLVTRLQHRGSQVAGEGLKRQGEEGYQNSFHCIPSDVPFRPTRKTPRPTIKGVQTAIVTGPGGEEIHTDEHGRVKVHFHWDRNGSKDDKSSCWIRVSQLWAGAGWGAMWIPRIGQEVVVDFIEGDPDRPLIVGRVYHGANVPPYPLPAEKTKSTIKSNSSPGGGGFNELRFEDRAGSEEIFIHGEKDWNIVIKHDKTEDIGNDKSLHVGHDEKIEIDHDQSIRIGHDRAKRVDNDQSESIGGNKRIKVAKNHTEVIEQNESISINGDETLSVKGARSTTVKGVHTETVKLAQVSTVRGAFTKSVGAAMALSVTGSKTESVGASSNENVGGGKTLNVSKNHRVDVGKDQEISIKENASTKVGKDRNENVGKHLAIVVGEQIKVDCGSASITISKDGNITVQGKDLTVTAKGDVKVKGKKIKVESDGTVDVKASGKVIVKGSDIAMN